MKNKVPTRSVDTFVANLRGASININNALAEIADWNLPNSSEDALVEFLSKVAKDLRITADRFDEAAHGKNKP